MHGPSRSYSRIACISTSKIQRPNGCDMPVSFTDTTEGWGSCKAEPTSGDPSEMKFTSVRKEMHQKPKFVVEKTNGTENIYNGGTMTDHQDAV
ncbi:hypothetical protein ROHU_016699 [Labeo rohita]|uniref:Uncharacterized protein n=1 Tax=Labeo rohita TaxID=84645 RepID=A0A498NIZ6_LABRO|nr:hypothetical protein ROHU_016699 [Labeo rohita]